MALELRGTYTALVTPFHEDGSFDEESFRGTVEYQIEQGISGVVPCGTTGEAATLSGAEQLAVVTAAVAQANGRVPVIAGAGGSDTAAVTALAKQAVGAGADAILSASPPYNKPTPSGLDAHYRAIAEAADGRPVILYNVPGRTASNMPADVTLALAKIPGVVAVKEASGDVAQVEDLLLRRDEGFAVLSGDDSLTLPLLGLGIDGVISVVSNEVPGEFSQMVEAGLKGDFETARRIHFRLAELMRLNFVESNPIPVKTAVALMGRMPAAHFRLPLCPMSDAARAQFVDCLTRLGLLESADPS